MMQAAYDYDLILPPRVVLRCGARTLLGEIAASLGNAVILFDGTGGNVTDELCASLDAAGVKLLGVERVTREPQVADVDAFAAKYRTDVANKPVVCIGVGGGSAMDIAKSIAAMVTQPECNKNAYSVQQFLEGVGCGAKLTAPPCPVIAMPTTAGTGAEATRNAVISSTSDSQSLPKFKKSLRDDRLMPRVAIIDPELSLSCPAMVTACSGLDAITQLLESGVAKRRQAATWQLSLRGCILAFSAMRRLAADPSDITARAAMAEAAFLSGVALTNAGLGMAHGIAPALGLHAGIPHGAACAVMLAATIRTNTAVCAADYATLSRHIFSLPTHTSNNAAIAQLVAEIEELLTLWQLPKRLRDWNVHQDQLGAIVADSFGSSMNGNPRTLTAEELRDILEAVM